ncbi:hypothetical protein JCM33374_g5409 [Metschnikowia sp. JCM 33374]|nr:hypothetical protein JCM33374_g5409 [Metschnikowia sp. JCM 33374]
MSEDTFSPEYFRHLLTSLTLNSRALIVELTGLAEKFVDNAQEIVGLVEERINKILPKYKLYSFYLMDSIIKNIGNPYNLMFATNLYKNFTETYLIIDDTPTRQNMINLFKTWISGKTSAGSDLFPKDTLLKVEKFIIQATSLNSSVQAEAPRISRDMVLRESNYLLQYVIALDEDLEMFFESTLSPAEYKDALRSCKLVRNNLIIEINLISEGAMLEGRDEFEIKKDAYVERLREIRRVLDDQGKKQQTIFKEVKLIPSFSKETEEERMVIHLNVKPKDIDVLCVLGETLDSSFEAAMKEWGKSQTSKSSPFIHTEQSNTQSALDQQVISTRESLASSFGLNLESVDLQTLATEDHGNELNLNSSGASFEDEGDGYDPELTLNESDVKHSPPTSPINVGFLPGKSSLKRANLGEDRAVKRVRFEV